MNRYENTRASKIMDELTKNLDLNISALAKDLNISHTNLWFYFHGRRKWNLETWLNTLAALGCLEVHKYGGIHLKIPIDKETSDHFEYLYSKRWEYIKQD